MKRLFWCIALISSISALAQLRTSRLFSSGMILQCDREIPVWGKSFSLDSVFVSLNGMKDSAKADGNGNWELTLDAQVSGGPYSMTVRSKYYGNTVTYTNVYLGDVWLAAGQSNMEMTLSNSLNGASEASSSNDALFREFKVSKRSSNTLLDTLSTGSWLPATSSNAGGFSAVAYYFGKDLRANQNVPVGIVNVAYGGSRIEAWMSDAMLGFDESQVELQGGVPERQPTVIYNAMLNPILRFPYKGILWYQGESNADYMEDALSYGNLFETMIRSWRQNMGQGNIPFLWVQLPAVSTAAVETSPGTWDSWPQLRACQHRRLSLPSTGEVVTIDVGDVDIHPTNKKPVGQRLAKVARNAAYGESIVCSGPVFQSYTRLSGGKVELSFSDIGGGLVGDVNDSLKWFSIAGSDGVLYKAKAYIDNDKVIVWNDQIPNPEIIRYAWEYNPVGVNFFNAEGFPAVPFYLSMKPVSYGIHSFTSDKTTIERGSPAILTWKVYGSDDVKLNGVKVDSVVTLKVFPMVTTDYKIRSVNREDANDKDSVTITITVIDPQPLVSVTSNMGDVIAPNTQTTLQAMASAPGGGTITQVEFFVDGVSYFADQQAPYEVSWTPAVAGVYEITAEATDANTNSTLSSVYEITVTDMVLLTYEAEQATLAGAGTIKTSALCSNGQYMDLTDPWTLKFTNVNVPQTGTYQLTIAYLLNYQSPKSQTLKVNGSVVSTLAFTAPNTTDWKKYYINVSLNQGANLIELVGSWHWMSFDYIAVAVDANLMSVKNYHMTSSSLTAAPNPFSDSSVITVEAKESGNSRLELTDLNGNTLQVLHEGLIGAGRNSFALDAGWLKTGLYLVRWRMNDQVYTKKISLIR